MWLLSPARRIPGKAFANIKRIRQQNIRVNIEADSLNSVLLGPDAKPDSPVAGFFAREVMREMTLKAGQKCTAIRRVLVPAEQAAAATGMIVSR